SRFYLSLEDDLLRLFNAAFVDRVLQVLKVPDDVPIENKSVTRSIQSAQGQVESQNFESRKNVLKYDDVMSRQREVIYAERREVLEGADLHEQIRTMIDEAVAAYVVAATEGFPEEWDLDALWAALGTLYPVSLRYQDLEAEAGGRDGLDREELLATLQADAQQAYDAREAEVGEEVMRELERRVLLSVLDRKWREHLYEMDYLREGIGLRAYSQRDPLVEYQREGFDMFNAMKEGIREETVGFLFNLEVQLEEEEPEEIEIPEGMEIEPGHEGHAHAPILRPIGGGEPPVEAGAEVHAPLFRAKGLETPKAPTHLTYAGPTEQGEVELRGGTVSNDEDPYANVGRNDKCPCGSGKKYKMCHGRAGGPGPTGQAVRGG
ncbi:MAG TPA: SEC-C metal-binding domain-containing protein, partial [Marmoricola sp.]|nr:SEC-C metal-binding domain-containing protein [Marmoricola sp.]